MQKRIQKETGNNCLKRIIVAFLAVIMMTTMLHPQMVQAATGTENGIFIESKNNEAPVFEAGKKKNTVPVSKYASMAPSTIKSIPEKKYRLKRNAPHAASNCFPII